MNSGLRASARGGVARSVFSRRALVASLSTGIGLGAILVLSGCAATGTPEPVPSNDAVKAAVTVHVVDNAYEPAEVEIAPGQAVRWVFEGPGEHDVVSDDASFVSELVTSGSYTHQFDEAGEFAYDCSIHSEMTGVVSVIAP